jgi:hypothetical protein
MCGGRGGRALRHLAAVAQQQLVHVLCRGTTPPCHAQSRSYESDDARSGSYETDARSRSYESDEARFRSRRPFRTKTQRMPNISVPDAWHIGTDPDLRIRTAD